MATVRVELGFKKGVMGVGCAGAVSWGEIAKRVRGMSLQSHLRSACET